MPTWLLILSFLITGLAVCLDLRRNAEEEHTRRAWSLDVLRPRDITVPLTRAELARYVRDAERRREIGYADSLFGSPGRAGALSERLELARGRRPDRGSPHLN